MKITYMYIVLVIVIVVGIIFLKNNTSNKISTPSPYDSFAQCISDAGAKFYGAYWCPHCQDQKKLFNDSKKLPYVECSTPDGKSQTQVCIDKNITGYPTWIFSDGSIGDGLQTLVQLAEKTGCTVPVTK